MIKNGTTRKPSKYSLCVLDTYIVSPVYRSILKYDKNVQLIIKHALKLFFLLITTNIFNKLDSMGVVVELLMFLLKPERI